MLPHSPSSPSTLYLCIFSGCNNNCTSRGTCIAGICLCVGNYTGPACETGFFSTSPSHAPSLTFVLEIVLPVDYTFSNNTPNATLSANITSQFQISITEIRELNPASGIIQSVLLSNLKFTVVKNESSWAYSANLTHGGNTSLDI